MYHGNGSGSAGGPITPFSFVRETCDWYDEVTSTNDVARQLYLTAKKTGVFQCATTQTAGRGRYGKNWVSPQALGFYGSVVLADARLLEHVALIQFAGAIAAAEVLESFLDGNAVRLKWPNDLILNEKKVGGVLVEVSTLGLTADHAVVGMGLNLLQTEADFPEGIEFPATSLLIETGKQIDPKSLPPLIAERFNLLLTLIAEHRIDEFWELYNHRWYDHGRKVSVQYNNGVIFEGMVSGISRSGGIILDTPKGREKLMAGTLRYVDLSQERN